MVAKIISGKNIRGAIMYNENKVALGKADFIMAGGYGIQEGDLTLALKAKRFLNLQALNPRVKTNALHISLNFSPGETLATEKLKEISYAYLKGIGFGDQPFLVYRHSDAAHPHLHIVTTNVQRDGTRIDIHNIGRTRSEKTRIAIEKQFSLVKASASTQKAAYNLLPLPTHATYGKTETKKGISDIVRHVSRSFKFSSINEFNAVLSLYNVKALTGTEGSRMRKANGLMYTICNTKGEPVGIPVKASAVYGKPTMKYLEKQFKVNELLRKPFREALKNKIDVVLQKHRPKTLDEFSGFLKERQVSLVAHRAGDGRLYGITFVDRESKCVFKGSDLGKAYSAGAITDRLASRNISRPLDSGPFARSENAHPDQSLAASLLEQITAPADEYFITPYPLRLKKKKRKRRL